MAHRLGHSHPFQGGKITAGTAVEYAQEIQTVELPPSVETFADEYDRIVGDRDRFLWKWIHNLFDEFTLSAVAADRERTVRTQKTLLTIFITTLDDLAERDGDSATFARARQIPFRGDSEMEDCSEIIDFLADLWDGIEAELEMAPRYEEFAEIFRYDFRQTVNAMDYSRLLNDNPVAANRVEAERYDAYNMAVFPYACVDLMYSPTFDSSELGTLRSLLCELQQMARIGNWLTTWERELTEGDVSSGIAVCALQRGIITPAEIADPDEATVDRLVDRIKSHGIESEFLREWDIRSRAVRKRTDELDTVDGSAMVDGFETVMEHHLTSDGLK